jgi:hypothetical protein
MIQGTNKNQSIILIVYNRPDKTLITLNALRALKEVNRFKLLVVRQAGCGDVKKIIDEIDWIKVVHFEKKYDFGESIKFKINSNVRFGLDKSFNYFGDDYSIIIEDDIVLGYDFLVLCDEMHKKYWKDKNFRGINAFSNHVYSLKNLYSYNLYRFGVGKGWSINKNVWKNIEKFWSKSTDEHFDCYLEPWLRGGFVVMPHCSRSIDIGWGAMSSHTPENKEDDYYEGLRKSFIGYDKFEIKKYERNNNLKSEWRDDCVIYKRMDFKNIIYYYKFLLKFFIKKIIIIRNIFSIHEL